MVQEGFRHLAASALMKTKEKDAVFMDGNPAKGLELQIERARAEIDDAMIAAKKL